MKPTKVTAHKRKGRIVKTHTRKVKGANPAPAIGVNVKQPKAGNISELAAKKAAGTTPSLHRVKGSKEAKAHMAGLRAKRQTNANVTKK